MRRSGRRGGATSGWKRRALRGGVVGLAVAPAFYAAQRLGGTAALVVALAVLAVAAIAIAVVQIRADGRG